MPIVKCPKCKKRYDPGVDDELDAIADAPGDLSLKVVCPACGDNARKNLKIAKILGIIGACLSVVVMIIGIVWNVTSGPKN